MTLSATILEAQEFARRLTLKADGVVLAYDEVLGGFSWASATPATPVTTGTAAQRAAVSGSAGQLFHETDTSVLLQWTAVAAAWKAVAAPGAWTSASRPPVGTTDAAYEGLEIYEQNTGKVMVLRRTTLGSAISGGNPLIWTFVAPSITQGAGITLSGDGSPTTPFIPVAVNRQQLANPFRNASGAIWQRGTTVTPIASTGGADAASIGPDGYVNYYRADIVYSRQLSGDTQGSGYCIRVQRPNGNAVTTATAIAQSCLTADSVRFAGRQCTYSIRVRKGSGASVTWNAGHAYTGTGTDQSIGSGFTGAVSYNLPAPALTTAWQTVSVTFTAGASVTQLAAFFSLNWSGTAGANDYFEFKDMRLDEGPNVLEHVPLSYAADLAECQRFFCRVGGIGVDGIGAAMIYSTTLAIVVLQLPAPMRAVPTLTVSNVAKFSINDGLVNGTSSAVAIGTNPLSTQTTATVIFTTSGLTAGRSGLVWCIDSAGYLDFSAEI